jgi:hypothetical protein
MIQPRRTSLIEAVTQAAVGLPLGFLVSYGVSLFHLPPEITAALITSQMFAASVARGYVIRRRFERTEAVIEQWRRNVAEYEASLNVHGDIAE